LTLLAQMIGSRQPRGQHSILAGIDLRNRGVPGED
jgi:hypothetical protein